MIKKAAMLRLLAVLLPLAGCATTPVGDVENLCIDSESTTAASDSEWVMVGNLFGRFDPFESQDIVDVFSIYSECRAGQASLRAVDDFEQAMSGWTTIETYLFSLALVSVHEWHTALVPKGLLDEGDFSRHSAGGLSGRGSLVAARSTPDGVYVVEKVLCNKGSGYSECSADYERGVFNLETGIEFGPDGEERDNNVRIDTTTYKRID